MEAATKDAYAKVLAALQRDRRGIDVAIATVRRLMTEGGAAEDAPAEVIAPIAPQAAAPPAAPSGLTSRPLAMDLDPAGVPKGTEPAPSERRPPPWDRVIADREPVTEVFTRDVEPPATEPEAPPPPPEPQSTKPTKASLGITTAMADVIGDVETMLADGPLSAAEIAERLTRLGKPVRSLQIAMALRHRPETFGDAGQTNESPPRSLYRLLKSGERSIPWAGIKLSTKMPPTPVIPAAVDAEDSRNLVAAAVAVIKANGKPMTAAEIAEAMADAGVKFPRGADMPHRIGSVLGAASQVEGSEVTYVSRNSDTPSKRAKVWQLAPSAR